MAKISQEIISKFDERAEDLLNLSGVNMNAGIKRVIKFRLVHELKMAFYDGCSAQLGEDFAAANRAISRNTTRRAVRK